MNIAIASDHIGYELKNSIMSYLTSKGFVCTDYGTFTKEQTDYPIWGAKAAIAVSNGICDRGIAICGTGVGISIAANKVHGIRAVVCSECYSAKLSREHNDTNILCFGSRVVGEDHAKMIIDTWLETAYQGGRHQVRVDLLRDMEENSITL